jgi:hypothetical protein
MGEPVVECHSKLGFASLFAMKKANFLSKVVTMTNCGDKGEDWWI